MNKNFQIKVRPHSIVDIITNSSTEIFVCERGHKIELVQKIVDELCDVFYFDKERVDVYRTDSDVDDGLIIININQYPPIPLRMTYLLEDIFTTGEYLNNDE